MSDLYPADEPPSLTVSGDDPCIVVEETEISIDEEETPIVLYAEDEPLVLESNAPGPAGRDGIDASTLELVAGEAIQAGQAVRVRQTTGKAGLAIASGIAMADAFGFALEAALAEHPVDLTRDRVTIPDWSAIAGMPLLTPGQTYFLSPTLPGGIQATPPATAGQAVCIVGEAVSPTTLAVRIGIPILL